ncbi:MAG: serine protease [Candidatus Acidiferrum sp.]
MRYRRGFGAVCLLLGAWLMAVGNARSLTQDRAAQAPPDPGTETRRLSLAVCPVVYQLDESASARGYHYVFYGNAFFINKEGYLITAAHVLSDFRDGGQPFLLLRLAEAPPRLVKAEVVAIDTVHDVAVLRAVTNPFLGRYQVAYLPLNAQKPSLGATVIAGALRPSRLKDPHSFDAPEEDYAMAEVLQYTSSALVKGQAPTDLFLFSHEVIRGQSGAPVVEGTEKRAVGIVEGRWLRPTSLAAQRAVGNENSNVGAAIPIAYAIPLLLEKKVSWQEASTPSRSE